MSIFHPKQFELFKKMSKDDTLPHAFLFTGPEGVGKLNFARDIAYFLQDIEKRENHPDIIETSVPLPIKEAKELKKRLSTTPYSAKYKIVIIDQAESMHVDAANSLLKMIEEPKGNTIFILVSSFSQKILETIHSRCVEIKFNYVNDSVIEKELDTSKVKELSAHWSGRPAYAAKLANNQKYREKINSYRQDCANFLSGSAVERFNIGEKYGKIKNRGELAEILRVWIEYCRENEADAGILANLLKIYKNTTTTNANFQYAFNNLSVNL
ncbi:MAG: AAA family ATPase [Candidatus Spechtbacterales bacterium]|nr:AAA family ATPase [Candidatus Spechtbacterales bacterium]